MEDDVHEYPGNETQQGPSDLLGNKLSKSMTNEVIRIMTSHENQVTFRTPHTSPTAETSTRICMMIGTANIGPSQ